MDTNGRAGWPVFFGIASLLMLSFSLSSAQAQSSSSAPAQSSPIENLQQCNDATSPESAIRGCSDLIKSQGYNAKLLSIAYNNRGNAYSVQGQDDLAMDDYAKAINLNPNFAEPLNNRAVIYRKRGEYDRALEDLNPAL